MALHSIYPPFPLERTVTIDKDSLYLQVGNMLNKMASVRYDGSNANYVSHLQPETDIPSDRRIFNECFMRTLKKAVFTMTAYISDKSGSGVSITAENATVDNSVGSTAIFDITSDGAWTYALGSQLGNSASGNVLVNIHLTFPPYWLDVNTLDQAVNDFMAWGMIYEWLGSIDRKEQMSYYEEVEEKRFAIKDICEQRKQGTRFENPRPMY